MIIKLTMGTKHMLKAATMLVSTCSTDQHVNVSLAKSLTLSWHAPAYVKCDAEADNICKGVHLLVVGRLAHHGGKWFSKTGKNFVKLCAQVRTHGMSI